MNDNCNTFIGQIIFTKFWVKTNDNKEFWHHWAKAETEKVEGEEKAYEKTERK